ncbi:hypothetical protein EST38_g3424 [Candolleomyces aberdarensis]|uniref:F-box domain-containing protein n=1 Tax=Candolleomyces aberdarensis TaxID=2316362 RepID=A0A4Q2DTJ8_9AGAR|nr:hypothetical protein EST38_g3424 [Candolleomyces aberdarensis]
MSLSFPVELVLEVVQYLRFDPPALCSCSLVSQHLAQVCRQYLYHRIELKNAISLRDRYNKLLDTLEKNPSLTEYTSELKLYMGMQVERDFCLAFDEKLPRFLANFHKIEKLTLTCQRHATIDYITHSVEWPFARLFSLKTLREVSIENVPMFPAALLQYAPHITHLHLSSVSIDPIRTFHGCPPPPTAGNLDLPFYLSLSTCRSDPIYVLTGLLQTGGHLSHFCKRISKLFLKPREGKLSDIQPYLRFMEILSSVQRAGGGTPALKHLTLALDAADVEYAKLGAYLPTTITSLVLDVSVMGWSFDKYGPEVQAFFNKLTLPWHHLRTFEFKLHASSMEMEAAKPTAPRLTSVLDTRLSSQHFPKLEECLCTIVFDQSWLINDDTATEIGMDGVVIRYEEIEDGFV